MERLILKFILLIFVLLPSTSWASEDSIYSSQEELLQEFYQAGLNNIVQVDVGEFSFKVHNSQSVNDLNFVDFVHHSGKEPLASLDYKANGLSAYYRAYKVSDSFICYELESIGKNFLKKISRNYNAFEFCFIVPRDVDEVVAALESIKKRRN